jgi:aminoglycoside phosphotransferase family enzyme/predicted kinase
MELARLLTALSDPAAYPQRPPEVEVRQTHISMVFLAGDRVYKVKKPVDFGFLDFRSLDQRRHFCEEEVRLNRRLAPDVYLGVLPVTSEPGGGLRVGGTGEVVEWAVEMERLPDNATLLARLRGGTVGRAEVESLAARVAAFHAAAEGGPHVSAFGSFDVVAGNVRDNLSLSGATVGDTVSAAVFSRLQALTEASLARLRPLIESRASRGVPRDTHGDLRLDHVYLFPDRPPPRDLVIIDCIEFNERFRYSDPVADAAFLLMDLRFHRRDDLAGDFADAYFRYSGDDEGRDLLHFYTAYRAAVRAKVDGLRSGEPEVAPDERARAVRHARAHWLLALGELEEPGHRPCLVLTAGLPGTGKSTLSKGLGASSGFQVIRSDAVRKELAGGAGEGAAFEEGIYTVEWTRRTYAECLRRAEVLLFDGERVVVDASFREESWRHAFVEAAGRLSAPTVILHCRAEPEAVRQRLDNRRGDVSDADWTVYQAAAERWDDFGPATRLLVAELPPAGDAAAVLAQALAELRRRGLHVV